MNKSTLIDKENWIRHALKHSQVSVLFICHLYIRFLHILNYLVILTSRPLTTERNFDNIENAINKQGSSDSSVLLV